MRRCQMLVLGLVVEIKGKGQNIIKYLIQSLSIELARLTMALWTFPSDKTTKLFMYLAHLLKFSFSLLFLS